MNKILTIDPNNPSSIIIEQASNILKKRWSNNNSYRNRLWNSM